MNMETTVRCPHCGRLYKFLSMMVGDQSACPSCRREAERVMRGENVPPRFFRPGQNCNFPRLAA